ncbi:CG14947 [Drosophila busckii]|uniref:CG14947 n=2 Tax=Drosophila busckii TaxID=30019 RepID=A0A0M4EAG4_DROBS|nr:CG14947 [Drosophila busckii]
MALMPQPRYPCNAKLFAKILEQRTGLNWQPMINRNVSRIAIKEQLAQGKGDLVKCWRQSESFVKLQDDYRIYEQSVDLQAFFGERQHCDKVSDVCLLNDHFMLVKMLTQPSEQQLAQTMTSKLPRCFKCHRGSRVSPLREEHEETRSWSARNLDEVETFDTTTRIQTERPVIVQQPQPQSQQHVATTSVAQQPLQLDTLKPLPLSLPDNNNTASIGRSPFYWFLWPFRRRYGQAKPQPAAVHKTYFVSWNKPPNTLWHGFGVERDAPVKAKLGLRRCRSAVF